MKEGEAAQSYDGECMQLTLGLGGDVILVVERVDGNDNVDISIEPYWAADGLLALSKDQTRVLSRFCLGGRA